jgi:glycine amidinotransferase/scyllo-inosamine-4-phosphate amidinotransferase 1
MSLVNVHNEWDPVEEIIVGSALQAYFPTDDTNYLAIEEIDSHTAAKLAGTQLPQQIIEETEEDINIFIEHLTRLKITVKRPTQIPQQHKPEIDGWRTNKYFCYCPRDVLLAVGNTIIETPNVLHYRYFETLSYKEILLNYLQSGSKWIAAPKPALSPQVTYLTTAHSNDVASSSENNLALANLEPLFDAANILRAGRDLFYLVSNAGNELGAQWLQNTLGNQYTVHPCRNIYSGVHIDTTFALLRPGLVLINPTHVNLDNLPEPLKKWDVLVAPTMVESAYSALQPISSAWIGMNLLMLAPDLAVVDAHQTELIRMLEQKGINTLPLKLRHSRLLSGGFHCITLDVRRTGTLENYFI